MVDTSKCVPELHDCADGFRRVDRAWIDKHYPRVPPPIDEPLTADEERLNHDVMALREAERERHALDVYPCPVHNPDQFLKWQAGEWPYPKRGRRSNPEPVAASGGAAKVLHDLERPTQLEMPSRADVDR